MGTSTLVAANEAAVGRVFTQNGSNIQQMHGVSHTEDKEKLDNFKLGNQDFIETSGDSKPWALNRQDLRKAKASVQAAQETVQQSGGPSSRMHNVACESLEFVV